MSPQPHAGLPANSLHREYPAPEPNPIAPLRFIPSREPTTIPHSENYVDLDKVTPLGRSSHLGSSGSVFENDPDGLAAVQFRVMQRRLVNSNGDGGLLLITSPGTNDGKSFTAHNLASALAEAGSTTLLLELDLRRPTQADRFGSRPTIGTIEVLAGKASPLEALRRIDGIPLGFIGLDKAAKNPTDLLRSSTLPLLFSWARSAFKWVVVDAPPVLPVADVEDLLSGMDLVAMVIRERWTPRAMTERAAERLGARLNFVILNDADLSTVDGYRYGYK